MKKDLNALPMGFKSKKNKENGENRENTVQDSTPKSYGFGLTFLKRASSLHSLLFPTLISWNALFFVLLVAAEAVEQYVGYFVGKVSSKYYEVTHSRSSLNMKRNVIQLNSL